MNRFFAYQLVILVLLLPFADARDRSEVENGTIMIQREVSTESKGRIPSNPIPRNPIPKKIPPSKSHSRSGARGEKGGTKKYHSKK